MKVSVDAFPNVTVLVLKITALLIVEVSLKMIESEFVVSEKDEIFTVSLKLVVPACVRTTDGGLFSPTFPFTVIEPVFCGTDNSI